MQLTKDMIDPDILAEIEFFLEKIIYEKACHIAPYLNITKVDNGCLW